MRELGAGTVLQKAWFLLKRLPFDDDGAEGDHEQTHGYGDADDDGHGQP